MDAYKAYQTHQPLSDPSSAELETERRLIEERIADVVDERTAELNGRIVALNRMMDGMVDLVALLVEKRGRHTLDDVRRIRHFTAIIGACVRQERPEYCLTERDVETIAFLSALHDLGMIGVSDYVLSKPEQLTRAERADVHEHCERGVRLLQMLSTSWGDDYLSLGIDICRSHHERWDGGGYPHGLRGPEIPIAAQIVALADSYDALTGNRPYRLAFSHEEALRMIYDGECGQFSDEMLGCLRMVESDLRSIHDRPDIPLELVAMRDAQYSRLKDIHFLLVDDNSLSLELNADILRTEGAQVDTASSGPEAIDYLQTHSDMDIILMDIVMPGMDGVETTRRIRDNGVRKIIIALTAEPTDENAAAILDAGANACLPKPLVISEMTGLLFSLMKSDRISAEKALEATRTRANTDPLTRVRNVTAYTEMVATLTEQLHRGELAPLAIVMCDVNNLKMVNDTYGHNVGDIYICSCCRLICGIFSHSPVFRIGGDEFVVIVQGTDFAEREARMAELAEAVYLASGIEDYHDGRASLAAGMAVFDPLVDSSVSDAVKRADQRMYEYKRQMKGSL